LKLKLYAIIRKFVISFQLGGFMLTFGGLGGTMVVASAALWFILPFRS